MTASICNESLDNEVDRLQVGELLAYIGQRDALLAGDFHAEPESASIERLLAGGRFSGNRQGEASLSRRPPDALHRLRVGSQPLASG